MRVWALASCSGLLALAACSADQPQSTQVDLPSPLDDDRIQANALSPTPAPSTRPVGAPQTSLAPPRPATTPPAAPSAQRPLPTTRPTTVSPQALRARVAQIRSQQAELPPPVMPLASPATPTPALATPQAAAESFAFEPGPGEGGWGQPPLRFGADAIAHSTPPPGPASSPIEPTAVALGQTQAANLSSRPLRHNHHQSHSARLGQTPNLTPEVSTSDRYSPPTAEARIVTSHRVTDPVPVDRLAPEIAPLPDSMPLLPQAVDNVRPAAQSPTVDTAEVTTRAMEPGLEPEISPALPIDEASDDQNQHRWAAAPGVSAVPQMEHRGSGMPVQLSVAVPTAPDPDIISPLKQIEKPGATAHRMGRDLASSHLSPSLDGLHSPDRGYGLDDTRPLDESTDLDDGLDPEDTEHSMTGER